MLQTWTMGRPTIDGIRERGGAAGEIGARQPARRPGRSRGTRARSPPTPCSTFDRYLRVGDVAHLGHRAGVGVGAEAHRPRQGLLRRLVQHVTSTRPVRSSAASCSRSSSSRPARRPSSRVNASRPAGPDAVPARSCRRSTLTSPRRVDRRRRDRVARLHAGAPRPRLRDRPGRARHLHEHPDQQRLRLAGTSPTGPDRTRSAPDLHPARCARRSRATRCVPRPRARPSGRCS